MKISRKQAIYGSVLGVAVIALAIDKVFFSEPSSASAAPAQAPPAERQPDVAKSDAAPVAPTLVDPHDGLISDHLKSIPPVDLNGITDAFSPSPAWVLAVRPPPPPAAPPPPAPVKVDHSAADFAAAHKLTAVLASHNGGAAIVDGQTIQVGQMLDGFTLTAVHADTAHFTGATASVDLNIDQ